MYAIVQSKSLELRMQYWVLISTARSHALGIAAQDGVDPPRMIKGDRAMKLHKNAFLLGACAFGLMLGAAPVNAAEFGDWDANADARITAEEFRTNFEEAGVFNAWDANDDMGLSESEFESGLGDDTTAFNTRFGDDAFGEWDLNDDDTLSNDEFNGGVYASYDRDGNKVIEEPEFGDVGDDIGDGGFWDV
jgi:hypothetical protein